MSRHTEFWFSDGSIVLVAGNISFRVHKSLLARHSIVFRDMFSFPQPTEVGSNASPTAGDLLKCPNTISDFDSEALEGCPALHLHDTSDDVTSLLYALYDGPKFGNNDKDDFRVVSGVLRLSNKYMIESLREKALTHLSQAWPSTLKGWDTREEILDYNVHQESRYYPNPVEVINLAREVNAPCLLPSAFYDLSRYPLSEIFDCIQDESVAYDEVNSRVRLSLSDTQKLAVGKEASSAAVLHLIQSLTTEGRSSSSHSATPTRGLAARHGQGSVIGRGHRRSDSNTGSYGRCVAPAACWRDACELVELATQHYLLERARGAEDPLYVVEELALLKGDSDSSSCVSGSRRYFNSGTGTGVGLDEDLDDDKTCRPCARAFGAWAMKERERLWRTIPSWFRLDV